MKPETVETPKMTETKQEPTNRPAVQTILQKTAMPPAQPKEPTYRPAVRRALQLLEAVDELLSDIDAKADALGAAHARFDAAAREAETFILQLERGDGFFVADHVYSGAQGVPHFLARRAAVREGGERLGVAEAAHRAAVVAERRVRFEADQADRAIVTELRATASPQIRAFREELLIAHQEGMATPPVMEQVSRRRNPFTS